MPVFEYKCGPCGIVHTARRHVDERALPSPCPACGEDAPRIFSVPRVMNTTANRDSLKSWGDDWRYDPMTKAEYVARERAARREAEG